MPEVPRLKSGYSEDEKSGWVIERADVAIDINAVARLLEPWRGARRVASAVFLAGGLMNRNYRVRVGNDDVVLRFYDRNPASFSKEIELLRELSGVIPVPELLYAERTAE